MYASWSLATTAATAAACLLALPLGVVGQTTSTKRGLVYISNTATPGDNRIWVPPGSGLTWYHNFGAKPTPLYDVVSQDLFEFVPTFWGIGDQANDTSFLKTVQEQIKSGRNIKHVLTFNDPDAMWDVGGSNIEPERAAQAWIANVVPLRKMGIKVALPSLLTDHDPNHWIDPFLANCSTLLQETCDFDFLGVHAYGDMTFLKERVDKFTTAFPNKPVWLLEYALHNRPVAETQAFFNASLAYLDGSAAVERYAYFGSFRAPTSGVGPNVAMLDWDGKLTDIGNWYLGKAAGSSSLTGTKANGAVRQGVEGGIVALAGIVALVSMMLA